MNNNDSLLIESKMDDSLTNKEKSEHFVQRYVSMKMVISDLQQKLTVYKNRCIGMDSLTLMLKESKLEVVKLKRHSKALETALANLQNRLASNGLSSSVNIQESELYIPGTSIQTLDNLAKENARLRNLIKNGEGQPPDTEKSPSEDRTQMDNLEAENNQIKAQLFELQSLKMDIVAKYDTAMEEQEKKLKAEIKHLEQKLKEYEEMKVLMDAKKEEPQQCSVACQTSDPDIEKVDELRLLLKQTVEKCNLLDEQLDSSRAARLTQCVPSGSAAVKDVKRAGSFVEDTMKLKAKLDEVTIMNKRWQEHSTHQERQIHTLNSRILELENPDFMNTLINDAVMAQKQEFDRFRSEVNQKDLELQELKKQNQTLSLQLQQKSRAEQPQVDMSIVEILKQQIQVCTEDFDTERKDREQAVSKVKELQVEVGKLKQENEALKKEILVLKDQRSLELQSKLNARSPQTPEPSHYPFYQKRSVSPSALPVMRSSSVLSNRSPSSSSLIPSTPDFTLSSTSPVLAPAELYPDYQQGQAEMGRLPFRTHDFNSLPRRTISQHPLGLYQADSADTVSMPVTGKPRNEQAVSSGNSISCPKCNKMFSESQESELLQHINTCSD